MPIKGAQRLRAAPSIGFLPGRRDFVSDIKRLVLDVLKPHRPSLVEMSQRLSALKGVDGVNCSLTEVDQETESLTLTVEGSSINYESVEGILRELGAVVHSVDVVASGKRLVESVRSNQNHG